MSDQIIELAIRAPKPGKSDAVFTEKMRRVVDALLRVDGVGPERGFTAFTTQPANDRLVAIGMTRYANTKAQKRATRNLGVLRSLVGFLRVMKPSVGVFMRPHDAGFDLASFAAGDGAVVEFSALTPATGVSTEAFLATRGDFLAAIRRADGVTDVYTFDTTGGIKAKDSIIHAIVYRDRAAFDSVTEQFSSAPERENLTAAASVTVIAAATATVE